MEKAFFIRERIPLALTIPVPQRHPLVITLLTPTYLETKIIMDPSHRRNVDIKGLPFKNILDLSRALNHLIYRVVPDNLEVSVDTRINGSCLYPPGITAVLLKGIIDALIAYYGESFEEHELSSILENLLRYTGIHELLLHPLALSVLKRKNIASSSLEDRVLDENLILTNCIVDQGIFVARGGLEDSNVLLDIAAKLASIALNGLLDELLGDRKKYYMRIVNSLWYMLWSLPPREVGVYTPVSNGEAVFVRIEGGQSHNR